MKKFYIQTSITNSVRFYYGCQVHFNLSRRFKIKEDTKQSILTRKAKNERFYGNPVERKSQKLPLHLYNN